MHILNINEAATLLNQADKKELLSQANKQAAFYGISINHSAFSAMVEYQGNGYAFAGLRVDCAAMNGSDRVVRLRRIGRAA